MKKFTFLFVFAIIASLFLGSTAFGQIAQRGSSTTNTSTGTTLQIDKPTGVIAGDIMIVNIVKRNGTGTDPSLLGWTLISGGLIDGSAVRGSVLYRVAGNSEPANYTFALGSGGTNFSVGAIVAFSGVNVSSGPFDVAPLAISLSGSASTTATASGITTVTPNAAVVMLTQSNDDNTWGSWTTTNPGSLAEIMDETYNGSSSNDQSVGAAWALKPTAGATGNGTATQSGSDRWGAILIALKPLPPSVVINPPALSTSTILVGGSVPATATRSANATWPNGNGSFVYTWSSTGPAAVSFTSNPNTIAGTSSSTTASGFSVAGTYTIKCTVQEQGGGSTIISSSKTVEVLAAAPTTANLWATSSDGNQVSSFVVSNGTYFSGPANIFDPFPSTTQTTAALGMTAGPGGNFYWLPNDGTNGVVNVYASTLAGGSITLIGSLDVNGASNNTLGFVRLGMDGAGNGWILAGDGTTLYLAKFVSNGILPVPITIESSSVSLIGGAASTFQNGDLCVSGNGTIYALANDGGGVTQIFKGVPNGASTTLTKSFDLVDNNNAAFSGRVNGVAFDLIGSIYLSTDNGLYYVDAATVNGPAGTVGCFLVRSQTGLQDLASNVFPSNSLLPVKLISFTGTLNGNTTNLNWVTENIQNFSHFEVERSIDGINFTSIASKNATGDLSSRATYLYGDNMTSFGVNYAIYYRLKMVDLDGKFAYSNVILVRKDGKAITDIKVIPNPLIRGSIATIRFEASERATVNLNVLDMSGRTVLRQQNNVEQGINSIPLNNFTTLQPGTYIIQLNDGVNIQTTKFIIAK